MTKKMLILIKWDYNFFLKLCTDYGYLAFNFNYVIHQAAK